MSNPPATLYGEAERNDRIEALVRGRVTATATAGDDGFWMLMVPESSPGEPTDGDLVSFTINGHPAEQTEVWQSGGAPANIERGVTLSPREGAADIAGAPPPAAVGDAIPFDLGAEAQRYQWMARRAFVFDIDDALWDYVKDDAEAGRWNQAVSSGAIFLEARIREWGRFGNDKIGKDLMHLAFAPQNGPLRLGGNRAEEEGWHQLAMGFAAAISNVVRHHVPERADIKRYCMTALGTASLILTQVRHQHPEIED